MVGKAAGKNLGLVRYTCYEGDRESPVQPSDANSRRHGAMSLTTQEVLQRPLVFGWFAFGTTSLEVLPSCSKPCPDQASIGGADEAAVSCSFSRSSWLEHAKPFACSTQPSLLHEDRASRMPRRRQAPVGCNEDSRTPKRQAPGPGCQTSGGEDAEIREVEWKKILLSSFPRRRHLRTSHSA